MVVLSVTQELDMGLIWGMLRARTSPAGYMGIPRPGDSSAVKGTQKGTKPESRAGDTHPLLHVLGLWAEDRYLMSLGRNLLPTCPLHQPCCPERSGAEEGVKPNPAAPGPREAVAGLRAHPSWGHI